MNSLISDVKIAGTINRLHGEASKDMPNIMKGFMKSFGRKLKPEDMANAYIAISREQGELLYQLIRSNRAKNIVEFGTSFGISTLYLAAAAKDNGGSVITTELLSEKCKIAHKNFQEANLEEVITLLEGDAMETLKSIEGPIDFLLLDGWNDLYLPLIKLLEPKFQAGAIIITDNSDFASAKPFIQYVRGRKDKYISQRLKTDKGGTEFSCYIGLN